MLRTIIIGCFLFQCIESGIAQRDFALKLMALEKSYFDTVDDRLRAEILLQKVNLYINENVIDAELLTEVKRIDDAFLDSTSQSDFFWNAAIISYLTDDTYYALHYIERYVESTSDSSNNLRLAQLLIYSKYDVNRTAEIIESMTQKDIDFTSLICLLELESYSDKNKKLKTLFSLIIPGSGMIINGNVAKGGLSLGLNIGSALLIKRLIANNLYVNAFAWGSNLIGKFYFGNINLTQKLMSRKESRIKEELANDCELSLQKLLTKYPLDFK